MKKNKPGFTLVELVIVIVIVGILSVISVPIYRGYIEKAIMAEGQTLLGAIGKAELAYHLQHRVFLKVEKTDYSPELNVDARGGKYFSKFYASPSGSSVSGGTTGRSMSNKTNNSIQKSYYGNLRNAVYIEVYGKYKKREYTLSATQYANGMLRLSNSSSASGSSLS